MGSNNNPWSPYNSYKDCSQGICSIYCPQWCYIVFSPPPPYDLPDDNSADSSGVSDFSPLIIAIIGILATIFLLITYFAIISKYCRQRSSDHNAVNPEYDDFNEGEVGQAHQIDSRGLEEGIIKSITMYKYKKRDGFVEGTECSVCLNEFKDDENLRLLPKCDHAFHVPCIDTWLKSNASCPLCRSDIPPTKFAPQQNQLLQLQSQGESQAEPPQAVPQSPVILDVNRQRNDTVINVQDLENLVQQEDVIRLVRKKNLSKEVVGDQREESDAREHNNMVGDRRKRAQGIRRSFSLDSSLQHGGHFSIADMLRKHEFEEGNLGMERVQSDEESNSERISSVGFGRCCSTGRLLLISKDGKGKKFDKFSIG